MGEEITDAEFKEAAEAYLKAHDAEWETRQALLRMMKKRTERSIIVGGAVIEREEVSRYSDKLTVARHLCLG